MTCQAGVNRSAFVAALALMFSGLGAGEAVELIREKRKPPIGMTPLCNTTFVELLFKLEKKKAMHFKADRGRGRVTGHQDR